MTSSETHEKGDGKILLIVASGVVLAALCIAMLAGFSAQNDDSARATDTGARPTVAAASTPERSAVPAMRRTTAREAQPVEAPEELKLPGSTVGPATETAASFEIDPDADFDREAHAAWVGRAYDKAAAYFAALVEQQPERAYTHYMLALSEWKGGNLDRAQQAMTRSAELNPGSIKTFINLSRIENDRGEFAAALTAARAALRQDEQSAAARFLEARSLRNLGRVEEALQALQTSLSIDGDNGYAHNLLGLMRIEQGQAEAAVQPLRAAARLEPEVAYIHNNLGVALEGSGKAQEALLAFRRAVELGDSGKAAQSVARLEPDVPSATVSPEAVTVAEEGPVAGPDPESGI